MRKKILALSLTLLTAFSLIGCGKSDKSENTKEKSDNHSDYFCYKTTDSAKDENGNKRRTFYFVNEEDEFNLTYLTLKNFTISDFYYGSALITNDSYGYNRYMVVDTKGNELIPYDTYYYLERLGHTRYFSFSKTEKSQKYGVIDSDNKQIIEDRYNTISILPTDRTTIFLCGKEDNLYDIRYESGKLLAENIEITDVSLCKYFVSPLSSDNTGIIVVQCEGKQMIISENSGKILADYAQDVDESVIDYYKTLPESGEVSLCMLSDDGTELHPISDDYINCQIFAIKGFRYIYDTDGVIVAKYSNSGKLTEKSSDGYIIHPIVTLSTRSLIIESEDNYSVKNYKDKEIAKFDKATYELIECTDFGFIMKTDDNFIFYGADGEILYENVILEASYMSDENTCLYNVGEHIIQASPMDMISYKNDELGICIFENFEEKKFYVKDDKGLLAEFDSDKWISIDDSHGYILIQTTDGVFDKSGKLLYTE